MNLQHAILRVFFVFFLISCQDDHKITVDNSSDQDTKDYFTDYTSPRYKWGYIDRRGDEIIEARYDDCRDFSESKAAVNFKGYWGYINLEGQEIIAPKYRAAYNFSEEHAIIQHMNKHYAIIDLKGNEIATLDCDELGPSRNGIHRVKHNNLIYYIKHSGKEITDLRFEQGFDFNNGYAIASISGNWGAIDTQGTEVIPFKYDRIKATEGNFFIVKTGVDVSLLDLRNKTNSPTTFKSISDINNQVAAVQTNEGMFLYNFTRNQIISTNYEEIQYGGEDRWFYFENNKYGILNSEGQELMDSQLDMFYRFREGRAGYMIGNFWGFIDRNGNKITQPYFPLIWDYRNGLARAIFDRGIGFLDTMGQPVIPPLYIEVRDFFEGRARFQKFR